MINDDNEDLQALFCVASDDLPDFEFKNRVMADIEAHHKLRTALRIGGLVLGLICLWFIAPLIQNIPLTLNSFIFSKAGIADATPDASNLFFQLTVVLILASFLVVRRVLRTLG